MNLSLIDSIKSIHPEPLMYFVDGPLSHRCKSACLQSALPEPQTMKNSKNPWKHLAHRVALACGIFASPDRFVDILDTVMANYH